MSVPAKHPDWRAGYALGRAGKLKPKGAHSKLWEWGWTHGRMVHCWDLWCAEHNRNGVFDGTSHPPTDPVPLTLKDADVWLKRYADRYLRGQSSKGSSKNRTR